MRARQWPALLVLLLLAALDVSNGSHNSNSDNDSNYSGENETGNSNSNGSNSTNSSSPHTQPSHKSLQINGYPSSSVAGTPPTPEHAPTLGFPGVCGSIQSSYQFPQQFQEEHPLAMPAQAVQLWGSYILVASQNYLLTLDVSNSTEIQPASFLVPPHTLLPEEELQMDSNPPPPQGSLWSSPPDNTVTLEALLKSSERRRRKLEQYIASPTDEPQQQSYSEEADGRPPTAMALSGRHAYITSWEYSRSEWLNDEDEEQLSTFAVLSIVDMSDPHSPVVVGSLNTGALNSTTQRLLESVCDVKVSGLSAYLALRDGGIAIIDISDSSNPTLESVLAVEINNNVTVTAVDISGMFAYLSFRSASTGGLAVVDISYAKHPQLISALYSPDLTGAIDVDVLNSMAYIVTEYGLACVDVSNGQLVVHSSLMIPIITTESRINVVETKGYVTGSNHSVAVVDLVSVTGNGLSIISYLQDAALAGVNALWVSSKSVYIGGVSSPLTIFDASSCQAPAFFYPPPLAPWVENINSPAYDDYNSMIPLFGAAGMMMGQYLLAAYLLCLVTALVCIGFCFRDRLNFTRFVNMHRRRSSTLTVAESARLMQREKEVGKEMMDLEAGTRHLNLNPLGMPCTVTDIASCSQSPLGLREQHADDFAGAKSPSMIGTSVLATTDRFEINPDDIDWGSKAQRIGVGAYGEVFKAKWSGTVVAVKRLFPQELDHQTASAFRREVKIMGSLRHPHIVLWLGACTQPSRLIIVSEFMEGGSLHRLLHKDTRDVSKPLQLRLCLQIARGLSYLHNLNPSIIHRDLSSANVLLDRSLNAKISDFGLSRVKMSSKNKPGSAGGTAEYQPPEVLRGNAYDEYADAYAYGILVWEIFSRRVPWRHRGMISVQVVAQVVVHGTDATVEALELPGSAPSKVNELIHQCWSNVVDERPNARECVRVMEDQLRIAGADLRRLASGKSSESVKASTNGTAK